jgi:Concanavalin A-like lectin/glucanases superfamily
MLAILSVDCCYFLGDASAIKGMAGLAWIAGAVAMFVFAACVGVAPFLEPRFWRQPRKWWFVVAALLPLLLIHLGVGGTVWTAFDTEGAAQATEGVGLLRQDPSFGVFRCAYFGRYVGRLYALAALPTYAFGPSLLALRLGSSLCYAASYLAFLSTLRGFMDARGRDGLFWASWAGVMVSLGEYALIQAREFEQTIMPLGSTMMLIAALLFFLARRTPARAVWLAWALNFLTCGYTPAYATWFLAIGVLVYLAFQVRGSRFLLLLVVGQGLVSAVVAVLILLGGYQLLNLMHPGPGVVGSDWAWRYLEGFAAEFNAGFSVIPVPLGIAAAAALWLALRRRDWKVAAVFAWCFGVVVASLTMQGSFVNRAHFDVHRTMVILPVMAVVVLVFAMDHYPLQLEKGALRTAAAISMLYVIYSSVGFPFFTRSFYSNQQMTDDDEMAARLDALANDPRQPPLKELCVVAPLVLYDDDLLPTLGYFFPGAKVSRQSAAIRKRGLYVVEFNETPRDGEFRTAFRRLQPHLTLHEVQSSPKWEAILSRISRNDGLVADYRFSEGTGATTVDSDANFDAASLSKGAEWAKAGDRSAVLLGGPASYVTLPSMPIEPDALTILVWLNRKGGGDVEDILNLGNQDGAHLSLSTLNSDGFLRLIVAVPDPPHPDWRAQIDRKSLAADSWQLVGIVVSGKEVTLYVGGESVDTRPLPTGRIDVLRSVNNLIGRSDPGDSSLNGMVGEFTVYDRALSAEAMRKMADGGFH